MSETLHTSWDVWAVQLLCALPLAASLATLVRRRFVAASAFGLTLTVQLVVLIGVPWIYRQAHYRHDLQQLQSLLEQSRIGEAQALAQCILRHNRASVLQGIPLTRLAADMERDVNMLKARSAAPLPPDADLPFRVARAKDLAMLGQTSAALSVLQPTAEVESSAAASALRGTIHEARSEWRSARDWYGRAQAAWQSQPDSAERTAGLIQAATGIGFTQRKLGHYREAEAAYHQVLTLAPTAESHFLLAQFYEDTQQVARAQHHAQSAASLDPGRYAQPSQQLTDKLITTLHFGCWGAWRADRGQ
jgi:tetratricopeptide (TPR) repeat protein